MDRLRRFLLGVFVLGVSGTLAELLLLGHMEDSWQFAPLALLGLSLLSLAWHALAASASTVLTFRVIMALFVVSALVGLYLHINSNTEFELEMYPSMAGFELFWESLRGAIPALAPGTMAYLGLLGLAFTYRHPVLNVSASAREEIP